MLRRALEQQAGDPRLRYHAAVALGRLGRKVEARAELDAALRSDRPFSQAREARRLLRDPGGT